MGEDLINEALHADTDRSAWRSPASWWSGAVGLWLADRLGSRRREVDGLSVPGALTIGLSQALALLPGHQPLRRDHQRRPGARPDARVSGALQLPAGHADHPWRRPVRLAQAARGEPYAGRSGWRSRAGFVAAAISGMLAIGFMLSWLRTRSVTVFSVYRLLFAGLIVVLVLVGR